MKYSMILLLLTLLFILYFFHEKDILKAVISICIFLVEFILTIILSDSALAEFITGSISSPKATSSEILTTESKTLTTESKTFTTEAKSDKFKDDFIIPDSDSRKITEDDLKGLGQWELRIARNEIYARKGRIFDTKEVREYFEGKDWYKGEIDSESFEEREDKLLNSIEMKNAILIREYEQSLGYYYN